MIPSSPFHYDKIALLLLFLLVNCLHFAEESRKLHLKLTNQIYHVCIYIAAKHGICAYDLIDIYMYI